jgi:molecular chaperone GrpE
MDDLGQRDDRAPASVDADSAADGPAAHDEVGEFKRQIDGLMRALAEAENVRRRMDKTAEDRVRYANETLLRDLIPAIDNFDRALGAARASSGGADGSSGKGLLEGVELIQRELLRVLERAGAVQYSAMGEPFDPNRHEAVSQIVSDSAPPNTVVAETAPGYMLHGRVLRPALVAVAAAPDEDAA